MRRNGWADSSALSRDQGVNAKRSWRLKPYLFLLPTFALLLTFNYGPPFYAMVRAFYQETPTGDRTFFVGLTNFVKLWHDEVLWISFGNMAILLCFNVIVSVTTPLLVAEVLYSIKNRVARHWYRIMLILPMVVPPLVAMLIWEFIFDPTLGLLNRLFQILNLPPQGWLQDPKIALYCFMIMGFPWVPGINVLIYLAGLNNISESVMESSKLDGAGVVRRFF